MVKTLSRGLILGKDILDLLKAVIDLGKMTITFKGCDLIEFLSRAVETLEVQEIAEIYLDRTCVIPAYSEMIVLINIQDN